MEDKRDRGSIVRRVMLAAAGLGALGALSAGWQIGGPAARADTGRVAVTQGTASHRHDCAAVQECTNPAARFRKGQCGTVIDSLGNGWTAPAPVTAGRTCAALYDDCNGDGPIHDYRRGLETVVIDEDGETITGYLHADNYFELYVNGQYVCRDPIVFTPFDSSVVRFKATYPLTLAVRLVDWEENLGLGTEGKDHAVGDGGFAAAFSDGTVTDKKWRCRALTVAPLDESYCIAIDRRGNPDSTDCPARPVCADEDPEDCKAMRFRQPDGWQSPDFDDSKWRPATEWSKERVGAKPAYTSFPELFAGARFIWSPNLDLDNDVICRLTVWSRPPNI